MVKAHNTMDALWVRRIELDDIAAQLRRAGKAEHAQFLEGEAHKLGMALLQIEGILQDAEELADTESAQATPEAH